MRYEGDRIVVLFDEVGYRTLSLEAVAARGLLEPLDVSA
jgi:ATP-dependent DNA helicase RecQ